MVKNIGFLLVFFIVTLTGCATAQMGYGTKSKKAIKLFEEGREAPQKNIDLRTGRPDFETGIEYLEKALKRDENFLEAHQMIGEFYRLSGKNKEAVYHYKRSLEIQPSANLNGQLYLDIGELQMRNNEFQDAIKYFDYILHGNNRRMSEKMIAAAEYLKASAE